MGQTCCADRPRPSYGPVSSRGLETSGASKSKVNLNSGHIRELKQRFQRYDQDNNGFIDVKELEQLLKEFYSPSPKEIESFIARFDANKDNEISYEEFKMAIKKIAPQTTGKSTESQMKELFRRFDTNLDGSIAGREMENLARYMFSINPQMKDAALKAFDSNKDKRVSFEEFVELFEKMNGQVSQIWKEHRESLYAVGP